VRSRPSTSSESYAPVSRGFRKHLAALSGNAVKLYVELLLAADFAGLHKGQVAATFAELATRLKMHRVTVFKAAKELSPRYITWSRAKNQFDTTVFTVQKYKSVKDFACSRGTTGEVQANDKNATSEVQASTKTLQASTKTLQAHSVSDLADSNLEAPKKLKKPEKQQPCELWDLVGIPESGRKLHPEFRELCEGLFATKGSQSPGDFMGLCMDLWQSQGKKIPAPFARAADEIRKRDKVKKPITSERPELEALPWATK
jgi:hypothetical protein